MLVLSRAHLWFFVAGFVPGGLLALYIAMWSSPPQWIENYQRGAIGEQRTAAVLAPLVRQGWVIIHDISRAGSNLDHVLVGPGGVFVLDTKNYRGTASVSGDVLTVVYEDGRAPGYRGDGLASVARGQGAYLSSLIRERSPLRIWVTAAVVLWTDFPQGHADGHKMTYLHGDRLTEWLLDQPARLNANQIAEIAEVLRPRPADTASECEPVA